MQLSFMISLQFSTWRMLLAEILGNNLWELIKHWCSVELVQSDTEFSYILRHLTKIYGSNVFLLTKIKPEYSNILYNPRHFTGSLVCRIRQVLTSCTIRDISLVPWCVGLDRFWHPVQSETFHWFLGVSD